MDKERSRMDVMRYNGVVGFRRSRISGGGDSDSESFQRVLNKIIGGAEVR